MDFSSLPDNVLLQIFKFLPFDVLVRISRVSKLFLRISETAISQVKSLDLDDRMFKILTPSSFKILLNLCSDHLERLRILDSDSKAISLAIAFSEYSCRRLISLIMNGKGIENAIFAALIRNNPGLKILNWCGKNPQFPDFVCRHLENLKISFTNDAGMRPLIGRVPNLKRFSTTLTDCKTETADAFFDSAPNLEALEVTMANSVDFLAWSRFWGLTSLITLELSQIGASFGDEILRKIAQTFLKLQHLKLAHVSATSEGIGALAALSDIRVLDLDFSLEGVAYGINASVNAEINLGIRRLRDCDQLHKVCFSGCLLSPEAFTALVHSCPDLRYFIISPSIQADSPEMAAAVLMGLSGIARRNITLAFDWSEKLAPIWKLAPHVKEVIKRLKDEDGVLVQFE